MQNFSKRFTPNICVTHKCNLSCTYCYQHHDNNVMSFDTAKSCIDWIFNNLPNDFNEVELNFIGGEPLLEFNLLTKIFDYVSSKHQPFPYIFYATTNGSYMTNEMKDWFHKHRDNFWLGLSLDGTPETQNINRSNSFDKIDFKFFLENWPNQSVKMTISPERLNHLAEDIIFIHSLGFKEIGGVNLCEGNFNWSDESLLIQLATQLKLLEQFYCEHDSLPINQMFDRKIEACTSVTMKPKKWCGIGTGTIFFDTDGKRYPCSFMTPMTFSKDELEKVASFNFTDDLEFSDKFCLEHCYINAICPNCAGANYLVNHAFNIKNKSKCKLEKLITLFSADLQARKLLKHPDSYSELTRHKKIEAIKQIRNLYLSEMMPYLN